MYLKPNKSVTRNKRGGPVIEKKSIINIFKTGQEKIWWFLLTFSLSHTNFCLFHILDYVCGAEEAVACIFSTSYFLILMSYYVY